MSEDFKKHDELVTDVSDQVLDFYKRKKKARIFHGGSNSTRSRNLDRSELIDISRLDNIIEISTDKKYVLVEPNVSLGRLVDATLAFGLLPPVISEFPAITVGGAVQGGAGESSSFKWGCFNEPCLEYEAVLGNGTKLKLSETENTDLFHGLASSCGSLGIITMIKLRLIPAAAFVKLAYHQVDSYEKAVNFIDAQTKGKSDFIDGIMFSKTKGVVMVGSFTSGKDLPVAKFRRLSDEWFYLHAKEAIDRQSADEEIIPTKDYLFRYDRGAFWAGREGLKLLNIPFNRLTRLLLAPTLKTGSLYRFLHGARLGQQFLIQDVCLPKENAASFIEYIDKNYNIYPLWLCPLRPSKVDILSPTYLKTDLVINVGVWGLMRKDYKTFIKLNRSLEDEVYKLKGRKVLYAHGYYKEEEFWEIYDLKQYLRLRDKYSAATVFPDVYEKTNVNAKYKPSIIRGCWKLLAGN